ncbi:avidin-related protein 1-like [Crotalus adamanteus]|uniref:Avidin-related protein 1-like n=1 Tax=Crotalus adamanteus TaxID=8729 RepID=A0AAW1C4N9_CROAD
MAIGLAALGLLAFLLGNFAEPQNSEPAAKCSLTGTWNNGLGNNMEINSVSDTGVFSGVFYTAPGRYSIQIFKYRLQGIQHQGLQPTFGFSVSANFDETTWVPSLSEGKPVALLLPSKEATFAATWKELLEGKPPKT